MRFFKYKDNHYLLSGHVKAKCTATRDWIPAVMYARLSNEDFEKGLIFLVKDAGHFCRERKEFFGRFEEVKLPVK